jgi:putative transposase
MRVAAAHAHATMAHMRLVPKATHSVVEVVYARAPDPQPVDPARIAREASGVSNLAAITSNQPGFVPPLVHGRPLKSRNQRYTKRCTKLQARLPAEQCTSRARDALTDSRTRAIASLLQTASRAIIDRLVREGIGTLVIGKNAGWKQRVELGKRTNQHFVCIPHARFIQMLQYKAEVVGIHVLLSEESDTSTCSYLDREPIGKRETYVGKRVKRGWFRSRTGRGSNADVNGSYNLLRKAFPQA